MSENLANGSRIKRPASTCTFWLEKKKRFCKTLPDSGLAFCSNHSSKCNSKEANDLCNTELSGCESNAIDDMKKENYVDSDKSLSPATVGSISPKLANVADDKAKPDPDRCHFWMERKRRFCRTRISGENKFCVVHASSHNSSRKRIPCPNDAKHSCYEDRLLHHLNRCNAKEKLLPEFHVNGINSGAGVFNDTDKVGIRDVPIEEVFRIIGLVKQLEKELPPCEPSVLSHQVLLEDINKPTNGIEARRHLVQQGSLVGNMQTLGFLKESCHYIEFGAGRGGLSHWVQLANKGNTNCQYLLIDKSSVRYKMDNYHKGEEQGPSFERLKIDIENVDLARVPSLKKNLWNERSIICMGKHLCGAATDLMLNCIVLKKDNDLNHDSSSEHKDSQNNAVVVNEPNERESRDVSVFRRVEGVVLALCCHHRCTWKSYVGRSWFQDHGLSARDFYLIVSMSAWATCGSKHISDDGTSNEESSSYNHPRYGNLLPEEREKIGISCKHVLDAGRIHFLSRQGYDARLIAYTSRENTLENMALVAKPLHSEDSDKPLHSGDSDKPLHSGDSDKPLHSEDSDKPLHSEDSSTKPSVSNAVC